MKEQNEDEAWDWEPVIAALIPPLTLFFVVLDVLHVFKIAKGRNMIAGEPVMRRVAWSMAIIYTAITIVLCWAL